MDPTVQAAFIAGGLGAVSLIVSVVSNLILTLKIDKRRGAETTAQLTGELGDREQQRSHDRRELRYKDRFEAYSQFLATTDGLVNQAMRFENDDRDSLADHGDFSDTARALQPMEDKLAGVLLLATATCRAAAEDMAAKATTYVVHFDNLGGYQTSKKAFLAEVTKDLGLEHDPIVPGQKAIDAGPK